MVHSLDPRAVRRLPPGIPRIRKQIKPSKTASRNKCLTSSNKKLLGTSALLVVTIRIQLEL